MQLSSSSIFLYSFSGGERGVTLGELKLACADVNIPSSVITEVVDISSSLYYLWKEDGRYVFKSQPNLNKLIISKMSEVEESELREHTKALLQKYVGKSLPVYIWPRNSRDIPDADEFKLVVLPNDDREFIKELVNNYGENPRINRNTIFFLVPMESERYNFESWLRKKLAWESISKDKTLTLTPVQKKEVDKNIKEMEKESKDALRRFYRLILVPSKDIKEIDLGIPVFGDERAISTEVLERLKADGEIVEKLSPLLIIEKYLGSKDYLELKQLYKTLLSTPGEPRISRDKFIESIKSGVKDGYFGFGFVRDGEIECTAIGEKPEITLQEYESIIRKELCDKDEVEETETVTGDKSKPTVVGTTPQPQPAPKPESHSILPAYKGLTLSVKLPKGKFSEFYRGVLSTIEDSFENTEVEITIKAKNGQITKSDYENRIKETLIQIDAEILNEETED